MVKTRRQARLETARLSLHQKTEDPGLTEGTSKPPPTVEELALRAAATMKQYLGSGDEKIQAESSGESDKQPSILLLNASSTAAKKRHRDHNPGELASSLDPGIMEELYFSYDRDTILSQPHSSLVVDDLDKDLMKRSVITPDFEKKECAPPVFQSRVALKKMKKAEKERSTGKEWFDMPATKLTPELRNDLKILRMRGALDPTHHYKANDTKELPKYFQVGRVISGPAEFYSSRIPRRQRKRTIVEELLANEKFRSYQKKKYSELQRKSMSGRQRYKNIKHRKKYKK